MIHQTHLVLRNRRFAILYRYDKAGEGLPMHKHDPVQEHDITCTRGRIKVSYQSVLMRAIVLDAGGYLVLPPGVSHEIEALEDNSSSLHEYLNGRPPEYKNLPPEELDITIESRIKK